jgi:lysophospholipid acyltransferase (LPLAT)-like uncharacterized protein
VSGSAERHPWWLGPAAALGAALLAGWARTWRIERIGMTGRDPVAGPATLFVFWHARMLPLVWTHRGGGGGVLISRHRDGELIARVVERLGFRTARGSSTRGGETAVLELLRFAAEGRSLGVTPDGPRGPAERVKPGVAWLAAQSGLPVVPVASTSQPVWRLDSWDGFRIPPPFARVLVAYGEPIRVPAGLDDDGLERGRVEIERALSDLTRALDQRAEHAR